MPGVWARVPGARVLLAGAEPAREVRALALRDARVEVTGYVDDMSALLSRASVAVAPLVYGAGIQNKILEAMATETPVVASTVAARSLGARQGQELLVGETAVDIAAHLVSLLEDPARAASIGEAGRHYVALHHSWDRAAERLEGIYAETIARWAEPNDSRPV
jgi:glycosyltransferase involved in cell wall biosynthesis